MFYHIYKNRKRFTRYDLILDSLTLVQNECVKHKNTFIFFSFYTTLLPHLSKNIFLDVLSPPKHQQMIYQIYRILGSTLTQIHSI